MRILVTGSRGFIGRNLLSVLQPRGDVIVDGFDIEDDPSFLAERVQTADFIVHLAGVNRPRDPHEFHSGNVGLTGTIVSLLEQAGRCTPIILSSSTQALQDNPYGKSKRAAEDVVLDYSRRRGASVCVYRLPNVFGKWGRPDYNSVVATFCHHIAREIPIQIHDPADRIQLVYIDDVMAEFSRALAGQPTRCDEFCQVPLTYHLTVGELAARIESFRAARNDLSLPDVGDPLTRKLYATYLSHLPEGSFAYPLLMHQDARGSFSEFIKTPDRGQVSINVSKPGIAKGNHWHHTKAEKFLVVSGRGAIRFRQIGGAEIVRYEVSGEKLQVVDIPPGYTHSITNLGETDMVTVMWASEPFDPIRPDTIGEEV